MLQSFINEDDLETEFVESLEKFGYHLARGDKKSTGKDELQRKNKSQTILIPIFWHALKRLNPKIPDTALEEAMHQIMDTQFADVIQENKRLYSLIVGGVQVTFLDGKEERNDIVQLVDWTNSDNGWLVVRQLEVQGTRCKRIPDVVLYLNGLPLVVIELKGITANAGIDKAYNQIHETYLQEIPDLFRTNLLTIVSDGLQAKYGTISSDYDRYMGWRDKVKTSSQKVDFQLSTLTEGLLNPDTLLEMLCWFVVFENDGKKTIKKIAGYHQVRAVRKAKESIKEARNHDGKAGVIWHTQGSGKSLLMTFLSGRVMHDPDMENPTLLVLTDRNDLDNQLFATFARCKDLLGEEPIQAQSTQHVKELLDRHVGGIIFSTIQKFQPKTGETFPKLTDRSNVIVLVDEAHRSQYGFKAKFNDGTGEVRHGLAYYLHHALPNAVFVAFTGTPVELEKANTRGTFGDYIDIYDITQAVADGVTVPIYYQARTAAIELDQNITDELLDEDFEEATSDLDKDKADRKSKEWSQIAKLVGSDRRLDQVTRDILSHYNERWKATHGKAMIVCMSRHICANVYDRIIKEHPDWHSDRDDKGQVKVVITGNASDPKDLQQHIRTKNQLEVIYQRYKNPEDPLKIVIVCNMLLTGFDAPCLNTLYLDKPMKGHSLMQAIARVNRVFGNKTSGVVVDYIGIGLELKRALSHYSFKDQELTGVDIREAIKVFLDALDVLRSQFYGFDYQPFLTNNSRKERTKMLPDAVEFVLSRGEDFKKRFLKNVAVLVKGFRLASGNTQVTEHSVEVAFFTCVRSIITKKTANTQENSEGQRDFAIQQIVNQSIISTGVVDILQECGYTRPDISVLSDEFLDEVKNMKQKNFAVEALRKILNGKIKTQTQRNVVQKEKFSKRLQEAMRRYHNRSIDSAQVIQELIDMAKDIRDNPKKQDNLNEDERAFYDALAQNNSAKEVMGDEKLRGIAIELLKSVKKNALPDWRNKINLQSKMKVAVKRLLKKYGYPPDLESEAVKRVLEQAEVVAP